MKTKEEILSPIRGEGSFINSVDYDDALKAMDEYAQQFKHPVMKSDNDNYEPFGQEWKAEMKKWNKDLLIDFLRKNLIELNQFKQPVEPQSIDEAAINAAKQSIKECLQTFDNKQDKVSETLFNVYPDEMRSISKLLAQAKIVGSMPNDKQVEEWYDINIGDRSDCSPSSAIYKFRLWLADASAMTGKEGWVDINERLPEVNKEPVYLALHPVQHEGDYPITQCGFSSKDAGIWNCVTHWRELPAPPQIDKEK